MWCPGVRSFEGWGLGFWGFGAGVYMHACMHACMHIFMQIYLHTCTHQILDNTTYLYDAYARYIHAHTRLSTRSWVYIFGDPRCDRVIASSALTLDHEGL